MDTDITALIWQLSYKGQIYNESIYQVLLQREISPCANSPWKTVFPTGSEKGRTSLQGASHPCAEARSQILSALLCKCSDFMAVDLRCAFVDVDKTT